MGKPQKTRARPAATKARDAALPDLARFGRLAEYNRKRHFGITPEPPGTTRAREPGRPREFVIQKHRATRLHYDFRLEHRGAMLSWAVPKGPSLDPSVKRLAMETEPHPMDYNQFEGVIPEGEYGGGTVMIWDKGVWAPDAGGRLGDEQDVDRQIRKGDLKFVLLGEKLAGSWVLVRTRDTRQWLLIKHRDEHVSDEDPTLTRPLSVVSGRTMTEIAVAAGATPRQVEQAAGTDPDRELARVTARQRHPRAARPTASPAATTRATPSRAAAGRRTASRTTKAPSKPTAARPRRRIERE
jgi:bifunctional non-homologous end joining protein LigD